MERQKKVNVDDLNIQDFKDNGMIIGENTNIYVLPLALEPYLVSVGK